ncbi:ABC transporter ATP-binding protein [soil metagenome]
MTTSASVAPPSALTATGLMVRYSDRDVLHGINIHIEPGTVTAIVGPNGCGKSTLLKTLSRQLRPHAGQVQIGQQDLARLSGRALAKVVGVLPQAPIVPERITVGELVSRGRDPHRHWYQSWSQLDQTAVDDAIAHTALETLRDRPVDELSGGQRQRAWIAMLLAQQTEILLLDEPTSFLDIAHQLDVLDLLQKLAHSKERTVVVVLHELTLAARHADTVIAMRDGRIVDFGSPVDTFTPRTLELVFDVKARVIMDDVTGRPVIIPLRRIPDRVAETAAEDGADG